MPAGRVGEYKTIASGPQPTIWVRYPHRVAAQGGYLRLGGGGSISPSVHWSSATRASVVGMRYRALGEAQTNRTLALSLAQLVILAVIPPDPTAADQTTLHGMPCQPELPGPYWSGLSGRLAVIS